MAREALVFAFHDYTLYTFERGDKLSGSWFGGPLEAELSGATFGPRPLHLIATLGGEHIPVLKPTLENKLQSNISLIYGLQYSGCDIYYRMRSRDNIELLRISPAQSSDDWPYRHYPPLLPYIPLRLSDTPRRASYDEFAERFWNMPEQQSASMVVAVPAPATIGMSLWGRDGDLEKVTIVFECDLKERIVKATNLVS